MRNWHERTYLLSPNSVYLNIRPRAQRGTEKIRYYPENKPLTVRSKWEPKNSDKATDCQHIILIRTRKPTDNRR